MGYRADARRPDRQRCLCGRAGVFARAAPRTRGIPLLPFRELFLPDNSRPDGLPVFFEGQLWQFERQIGIVFVCLGPPASQATATDGAVCFRSKIAVILRGPAIIEMAFPFQVERLSADPENYWRDLRRPRAQLEFPFPMPTTRDSGVNAPPSDPPVAPTPRDGSRSPERRLPLVDLRMPGAVDRTHGTDTVKGGAMRATVRTRPNSDSQLELFTTNPLRFSTYEGTDSIRPNSRTTLAAIPAENGRGHGSEGPIAPDAVRGRGEDGERTGLASPTTSRSSSSSSIFLNSPRTILLLSSASRTVIRFMEITSSTSIHIWC